MCVHGAVCVCGPHAGLQCRAPRSVRALLVAREEHDRNAGMATGKVAQNAVHVRRTGGPDVRKDLDGVIRSDIIGNVARVQPHERAFLSGDPELRVLIERPEIAAPSAVRAPRVGAPLHAVDEPGGAVAHGGEQQDVGAGMRGGGRGHGIGGGGDGVMEVGL